MKYFLFTALLWAQSTIDYEPFSVDKLRPDEIQAWDNAEKAFKEASDKYNAVIDEIKANHGERKGNPRMMQCGLIVTVELRGKYALISRSYHSCVSW